MTQYKFVSEQVMRIGAVLKELELAIKRCDAARADIGEEHPLYEITKEMIDNIHYLQIEKYNVILTSINSWLSVEVKSIEKAARIIEQEVKRIKGDK
jgi:hypothetical protein